MFFVYALKSQTNSDVYVGYTKNWENRLHRHNSGKVRSTKTYKPWVLIYYEAYINKKDATKREKELKMHAAKSNLLKRLQNSLKI